MEIKELAPGLALRSHIGWKFREISIRGLKILLQNVKDKR